MLTTRFARKSDQPRITRLLTNAFLDYDYFKMYVTNEAKRVPFVQTIQALSIKTALQHGHHVLLGLQANTIVAVAIVIPPTARPIKLWDYITAGGLKLIQYGGIKNTLGFVGLLNESNAVRQRKFPHAWTLEALAVAPNTQGQGVGGQMLTIVQDHIRQAGGGDLTFITNSLTNRNFYLKHGFHEFDATTMHRNHKKLLNWSFHLPINND